MNAPPRFLRRLVPRSNALLLWGVITPSLPLSDALEWLESWRHSRRSDPDFHPDHLAILLVNEIGTDGAASRVLRQFKDLLPRCVLVGEDRIADELEPLTRLFSPLQIASTDRTALEHRQALVIPASVIQAMNSGKLSSLLRSLEGLPLVLRDLPDDATLDLLRGCLRDQDVVVVPDRDPEPVPLLFLRANAPGRPSLNLDAERAALSSALGAACAVARATTLESVGHALSLHLPEVLHFGGHGDDGFLWFEGLDDQPHRETGERLAARILAALGPESLPQLIVLNACESDRFVESMSRVCRALVVMDRPLSDREALNFSAAFYRALRRPEGAGFAMERLPEALDAGRQAMGNDVAHLVEGKAPATVSTAAPGLATLAPTRGSDDTVVTVWFGTERARTDPDQPSRGFGTKRDVRLHTGRLEVRVAHGPFGTLNGGGLFRSHRVRTMPQTLREFADLESFSADLRAGLAEWSRCHPKNSKQGAPELLLFVHGYNVGFDEAARRAAQIHVDLQVPGVTAFYSWASADSLLGYQEDESSIVHAVPHLLEFLEHLLASSGAARFHLLAHSMGHRALLRVLENIARRAGERTGKAFGQIFLCAPDVGPTQFRTAAAHLPKLAERTTLYISRCDKALWLSRILHGTDRAGFYPEITLAAGIDTIATEDVSSALIGLGHGYYAGTEALLYDIAGLIQQDTPPDAPRQRLHPEPNPLQPTHFSFGS